MRIQAVRQATLEVTGSSRVRVHKTLPPFFKWQSFIKGHPVKTGNRKPETVQIDPAVWYIAVGLGHPGRVGAAKGWVVHPLKSHMSWVQYVARQYGSISWEWCLLRERILEYERNGDPAPLVDRL